MVALCLSTGDGAQLPNSIRTWSASCCCVSPRMIRDYQELRIKLWMAPLSPSGTASAGAPPASLWQLLAAGAVPGWEEDWAGREGCSPSLTSQLPAPS